MANIGKHTKSASLRSNKKLNDYLKGIGYRSMADIVREQMDRYETFKKNQRK